LEPGTRSVLGLGAVHSVSSTCDNVPRLDVVVVGIQVCRDGGRRVL
jgi:hypothetical protein